MSFLSNIKASEGSAGSNKQLDNSELLYGSVDRAAEAGSKNGHWLVYDLEGKQVTKRRLNDVETMVAAIKGELYAGDTTLPNPGFLPLNALKDFARRVTVRPLKHNFGSQDNPYRATFVEACGIVLDDDVFGDALAEAIDRLGVSVDAEELSNV